MASSDSSPCSLPPEENLVRDVLGYLNFSGGTPDPKFQGQVNTLFASLEGSDRADELGELLLEQLDTLERESPAFSDSRQARAVINLALHTLAAYRRHHADLLFHLNDEDFQQPFFLARVFEAVLAQGAPWQEEKRIVPAALDQLNDFLGYRPLAVLENGRFTEPYAHERFRPVPLYLEGAGIACGVYHDLIDNTLKLLAETPADLLAGSHFELAALSELALDVRAHDHTHPMNKRTNYMFGEWDPHTIDNRGRYRRFVVRKIVLDALLDWMSVQDDLAPQERLHDAAGVLCGTILMASAISGSGPGTHDSTVTLTTLLPKVARQRDAFYSRLLERAQGDRRKRLVHEAELTRQPFGHVRQHLNIALARYGAKQIQHRHLAYIYAHLGFPDASREQVAVIPSVSARFECEIQCRLSAAHTLVGRGDPAGALRYLEEIEDLLWRGVECGALIDPWNIIGFQGQFPLFASREDSIADERAETLLSVIGQTFEVYTTALGEAAVQEDHNLHQKLSARFRELAERWDRYATTMVEGLPSVAGMQSWESAEQLSGVLAKWRAAGEAAGDISFWREHVDKFRSAAAYGQVVDALLLKRDLVAARGLLMQWLGEVDEVGFQAGAQSLELLLSRWLQLVLVADDSSPSDRWPLVRSLFDYLEANAGEHWDVPRWDGEQPDVREEPSHGDEAGDAGEHDLDEDAPADDEDDLYSAAYDGVVYRDSAADGLAGETMDWGPIGFGQPSDLETQFYDQDLESRLAFQTELAELWQMVGAALSPKSGRSKSASTPDDSHAGERLETLESWLRQVRRNQERLTILMEAVWREPITQPTGDAESNIEYDRQMQWKLALLHAIVAAHVDCQQAQLCLSSALPAPRASQFGNDRDRRLASLYRAIFRGDLSSVRRILPTVLADLVHNPLLYVPLDNGGHPEEYCEARALHTVLRVLLIQLPRLGLLREAFVVLKTAFRMERVSRPGGQAVTEFDSLFRIALGSSLECLVKSSQAWRSGDFDDEELIDVVGEFVERYLKIWLKHSRTMRISSVESLKSKSVSAGIREFIEQYGDDLFQPRLLTPANLRTNEQAGSVVDQLAEEEDPLHPIGLLEDLRRGVLDREDVEAHLELIYSIILDKFDRFVEYSTTTTQSDYGEMLYSLLDFLRVEVAYERDSWNLLPVKIAHEQLAAAGRQEAALMWEQMFESNTSEMADQHIDALERLEQRHGMRLPSIADHLQERFIKPLAVNRIVALVPAAMEDAKHGRPESAAFAALRATLEDYLEATASSSGELPRWVREIEQEIDTVENRHQEITLKPESADLLPQRRISLREVRRQLNLWDEPLARNRKKGR